MRIQRVADYRKWHDALVSASLSGMIRVISSAPFAMTCARGDE